MTNYRQLTESEIQLLQEHSCTADDWMNIEVAHDFEPSHVYYTRFSGKVRLGVFEHEFTLAGGMKKHAGLYHTTLHNVTVGNHCCIENVKNYIANYEIGDYTFIENVDIILVDGKSKFGNGVEVAVLNETGGREVMLYDRLSAHQAYIMALYRHRPELVGRMRNIIERYAEENASIMGHIGSYVTIVDSGYIKNVKIGDYCKIEGAGRLKNGSLNSNWQAPIHIGYGVVCDDFIISSGSSVEDGTMLTRCFIGQACHLGHNYSASDSLFFSNCQEENGEACAISTSATSIMINILIGKTVKEALVIIENFENMIDERTYDKDILSEAIVYCDISKQPNRKICATLTWAGLKDFLKSKI